MHSACDYEGWNCSCCSCFLELLLGKAIWKMLTLPCSDPILAVWAYGNTLFSVRMTFFEFLNYCRLDWLIIDCYHMLSIWNNLFPWPGIVNTVRPTCLWKCECLIRSFSSTMYWMHWSTNLPKRKRKGKEIWNDKLVLLLILHRCRYLPALFHDGESGWGNFKKYGYFVG